MNSFLIDLDGNLAVPPSRSAPATWATIDATTELFHQHLKPALSPPAPRTADRREPAAEVEPGEKCEKEYVDESEDEHAADNPAEDKDSPSPGVIGIPIRLPQPLTEDVPATDKLPDSDELILDVVTTPTAADETQPLAITFSGAESPLKALAGVSQTPVDGHQLASAEIVHPNTTATKADLPDHLVPILSSTKKNPSTSGKAAAIEAEAAARELVAKNKTKKTTNSDELDALSDEHSSNKESKSTDDTKKRESPHPVTSKLDSTLPPPDPNGGASSANADGSAPKAHDGAATASVRESTGNHSRIDGPVSRTPSGNDGLPQLNGVDYSRFMHRVTCAVHAAQDHDGEIRLRLSPPELGSLKLEVRVHSGVLVARLEAETQAARNLLIENLPALRERLAEQGVRIERFDVDLMDHRPGGGSSQEMPNDQQQQSRAPASQPSEQNRLRTPSVPESTPAPTRNGGNARLNVII